MSSMYQHLKEKPLEIRLIQVIPNDDADAPIECNMVSFQLNEAPAYRCLSYCWGKPQGKTILVNGAPLASRKNLTDFLWRIRKRGKPNSYYWIDAICINQDDLDERRTHVTQMGRIYSQAAIVVGWLGWEWDRRGDGSEFNASGHLDSQERHMDFEDDKERGICHSGISYLLDLAEALREWKDNSGGQSWASSAELSKYAFDDQAMYDLIGVRAASFMTWASLGFLITRDWFKRAWIVQEASLAKTLVLVCGFHDISLMRVTYGPTVVMVPPGWQVLLFAALQHIANKKAIIATTELGYLFNIKIAETTASEFTDTANRADILQFFILKTLPFEASDARDKVYAPRALATVIFEGLDTVVPGVDMNASNAKAYTDFARYILQNSSSLDLLSYAEESSQRPAGTGEVTSLPSWVPDFSKTGQNTLYGIPSVKYDPLPSAKKVGIPHNQTDMLEVEGTYLTKLEQFGPPLDELFESGDFLPLIYFALRPNSSTPDQTTAIDIESLWRTLIGDCDGTSCPANPATAKAFKAYLLLRTAVLRHGDKIKPDLRPLQYWKAWDLFDTLHNSSPAAAIAVPSVSELKEYAEKWRTIMINIARLPEAKKIGESDMYGRAAGRIYANRTLFVAKDGRLGMAPLPTQKNDQVWLLAGARVPFILRPIDNEYRFKVIGEAYVHGVMLGEFQKGNDNKQLQRIWLK